MVALSNRQQNAKKTDSGDTLSRRVLRFSWNQ